MDFDHPPADPVAELERWLERASRDTGQPNPNAMALATIDPDGQPSVRIVLLKALDRRGVVFFTNGRSRKGEAIASNERVGLVLHWDRLERQVRIEGPATPIEDAESDAYFASRSRGARIGAWASDQSRPVGSRAELEARVREVEERFHGREVPRPPHWRGFRVSLERIEFWQGLTDRLHDRVEYRADGAGGWTTRRLCP